MIAILRVGCLKRNEGQGRENWWNVKNEEKIISVLFLLQWSYWEEKNVESEETAPKVKNWKLKVNNVVEI